MHLPDDYLRQALDQAKIRKGFTAPNPAVGAVIVRDGQILATGFHQKAGEAHAEIEALKRLNFSAKDATIYVTLEPCCHHGKTPPCTEALIKAGVKEVIYGYKDPNPLVAGKGEAELLKAGIQCQHLSLPEINNFYESYQHWQYTQTPFVTAKIAISFDGKIAGKNGERIQITGAVAEEFTHLNRKNSDAILTTAQTILHDDPQLNARCNNETFSKPIYILDSQLKTPLSAKIFKTAQSLTFFHAANVSSEHFAAKGARCIGGLNLQQVLQQMGKDGIHDLWVEAGGTFFSALCEQNLLQRALIYIAPRVLGEGKPAFTQPFDFHRHILHWQALGQDGLCDIRF